MVLAFIISFYPGIVNSTSNLDDFKLDEIQNYETGWLTPGATELSSWSTNVSNPLSANDNEAAVTDIYMGWVRATNFGLNIPTDAYIDGIKVNVLFAPWIAGDYAVISTELMWDSKLEVTNTGNTAFSDEDEGSMGFYYNASFGSYYDPWGKLDWNSTDFTDANFAVTISLVEHNTGALVAVDQVRIKVFYSTGEKPTLEPGFHTSEWFKPTQTITDTWLKFSANPLGEAERDAVYADTTGTYVLGAGYVIDLPADARIMGIELNFLHATWNGNTGDFATIGFELLWNGRNNMTSTGYSDTVDDNYSGWNSNFKNATLGGAFDTWGRDSWALDDLSYFNFAVKITLTDIYPSISESVDAAWIRVYYMTGADPEPYYADQGTYETEWNKPLTTVVDGWNKMYDNPLGEAERDALFESDTEGYALGVRYQINLPANAKIDGVEVMILHATWNGNTGEYATLSVELARNGYTDVTASGITDTVDDNYSGWDSNFKNVTLGSPTELWGRTDWKPADFLDSNFAVKIAVTDIYPSISESVDIVWVKIYYSVLEDASIEVTGEANVITPNENLASLQLDWHTVFHMGDYPMNNHASGLIEINGASYSFTQDGLPFEIYNDTDTSIVYGVNLYDVSLKMFNLDMLVVGNHTFIFKANYTDGAGYTVYDSYTTYVYVYEALVDPWIDIGGAQIYEFFYGDNIIINVFGEVFDPSNLGYQATDAYCYLDNELIASTTWQNASVVSFDLTENIPNILMAYTVNIELVAGNGSYTVSKSLNVSVSVINVDIPITEPWIEFDYEITSIEMNYNESLTASGLAYVYDPSKLGYDASTVEVYINGELQFEDNWANDTLYTVNMVDIFPNVDAVYMVTIYLYATNGTHEISLSHTIEVTVNGISEPITSDTTSDTTTDTSSSSSTSSDTSDDTSTLDSDTTENTAPAAPTGLTNNIILSLFGVFTITVIKRRK
ncbi:MAG: hypothetical protein INQ03_13705 [Candidatus Heimdallarchaeota archaeon]|nr:hypothetical protein [Candidatus Heimdallarchaeota archaeon]